MNVAPRKMVEALGQLEAESARGMKELKGRLK